MKRLIGIALLTACAGAGDDQATADSTTTDVDVPVAMVELTMPEAPTAGSRGRLAMRTAGPMALDGEWNARAGRCVDPPMLQILLEEQYDGMMLLLALPASNRVTTYPVFPVTPTSEGIPEGPAAQAGVQRIIEGRPYAWQAEDGQVDVYAWDGDRVSGRFALTMRNIATNERSKVAGSFLGVEALELGPEQCQPSAPPPTN